MTDAVLIAAFSLAAGALALAGKTIYDRKKPNGNGHAGASQDGAMALKAIENLLKKIEADSAEKNYQMLAYKINEVEREQRYQSACQHWMRTAIGKMASKAGVELSNPPDRTIK